MMTTSAPASLLPTHLQTVDEFEEWERQHAHEGSYEFSRGRIIEKEPIKQNELDLIDFLIRQFIETPQFKQKHTLYSEIDSYVDGGTQLVWYIVPKQQKIYVYTSPDESKAYKGAAITSAAPVLPDFQFAVADLFAKP